MYLENIAQQEALGERKTFATHSFEEREIIFSGLK